MAGLGVFEEEGGGEELDGVLLHAFIFFLDFPGLCLPYPTLDTRLSLILRPVSSPSMAGLGVFEEEGGGVKN